MPGMDVPELRDLYEFQTYLEANMQTWPEQWVAEGVEKGRQEGRQEGMQKGLLRQIELKFGTRDETVKARLQAADVDQLLTWAERVLTVESVGEVFG